MNYQKNYYPRRPVKSFQDLEVYQKLLAVSVAITKKLSSRGIRQSAETVGILDGIATATASPRNDITVKLAATVLSLPLLIAEAHSLRFSEPETAIRKLERVMLGCNQAVVYLEQYRDIENKDIEQEFFEEQIKNILMTRMKILHLQMSWKKFMAMKQKEQNV